MESIRELFRIGHGPSSSHTMGPRRAAEIFVQKNVSAAAFRVSLYGILAISYRFPKNTTLRFDNTAHRRTNGPDKTRTI